METIVGILVYTVPFGVRTVFLLIALWIMVKFQKFQYNFLGLLGSAAAASALDMIPYFGHFLAVPVLWLCLWKVTREDRTGVVFTTAISYALVFVMNLWLIGSLMGSLNLSARQRSEPKATTEEADEQQETVSATNTPAPVSQPTNSTVAAAAGANASTNSLQNVTHGMALKGVTKNSRSSMALISSQGKTYTLAVGESLPVETDSGKASAILEAVEESKVTLRIGSEKVELRR